MRQLRIREAKWLTQDHTVAHGRARTKLRLPNAKAGFALLYLINFRWASALRSPKYREHHSRGSSAVLCPGKRFSIAGYYLVLANSLWWITFKKIMPSGIQVTVHDCGLVFEVLGSPSASAETLWYIFSSFLCPFPPSTAAPLLLTLPSQTALTWSPTAASPSSCGSRGPPLSHRSTPSGCLGIASSSWKPSSCGTRRMRFPVVTWAASPAPTRLCLLPHWRPSPAPVQRRAPLSRKSRYTQVSELHFSVLLFHLGGGGGSQRQRTKRTINPPPGTWWPRPHGRLVSGYDDHPLMHLIDVSPVKCLASSNI